MRQRIIAVAALLASMGLATAQAPESLPVRKVVLYKNGMGYFEHLGQVRGDSDVEFPLPSSQLNDVLKSLTLLDLDGGRIVGVNYDSAAPLDRRLAELPIDPSEQLVDFLNQIRGVRFQAGTVEGRLLGAELKTRVESQNISTQVVQVSILASTGEVKLVELERAGGFRILDPALTGDLERFLELSSGANQRDTRLLKIQTRGNGERRLFFSYTSEAPIWKTTYRIVIDPKRKPLLQGWAIVDNTSSLNWNNVELSLVSGAPISFIQELSQPIYGQRQVIPIIAGVSVAPEVHEGTVDELRTPSVATISGRYRSANEKAAGSFAEAVPAAAPPPPMDLGEAVRQQAFQTAAGQALAEQFEYRLPDPVTVGRNQSALLSIIQSDVDAEKVSVFREGQGGDHPRLSVWLRNSTGATLDGGAFTLIDSNSFAGEGLFETIQPAERRLLSYAVDLAVEVSTKTGNEQKRVERLSVHRGVLRLERKTVEVRTYKIRNNATSERAVILEHPLVNGWELVGDPKPDETSANHYRFRVPVPAGSTKDFTVRQERPDSTVYGLTNIDSDLITLLVRDRSIDPETEKTLREIASRKAAIQDLTDQLTRLNQEKEQVFNDQKRIRDNLARLGSSPEETRLRQRYIEQLNTQEDQLAKLRADSVRLEERRDALQKDFDRFVEELDFERKL